VDLMEKKELSNHPERRKAVSENLEKRLVWDTYAPGKEIGLVHVKLDGQILSLSEGEVLQANFNKRRLILKRSKFKGRSAYDGLDVPKQEGDYAITEVKEGDWFYKHTYLRKNGEIIGWYYNINTPVEFYPEEIRYVDLDIDVVGRPDGKAEVKDEAILEKQFESGHLSANLKDLALKTARDLLTLAKSSDADHHHFGLTC
jgi:protein associated with RNAse G/E